MLNLNGTSDPFYRYKMPELQVKFESGVTKILNLSAIAKAVGRSEKVILKYWSLELGCNSKLSGQHSREKLQELLQKFITDFVLCPECGNPETDISWRMSSLWGKIQISDS